jgi:hypothetical protein
MAVSAAGTILAFNALEPKFADLAPGLAYAVVFSNQTGDDVEAGVYTFYGADADPADPCVPDTFVPLQEIPECSPPLGAADPNYTYKFTPENPLKAGDQCSVALPCPKQFFQVQSQGAQELDIIVVVTRLKRTGM